MPGKKPFFGRAEELHLFEKILRDSEGQAVLITGSRGMGKTALLDQFATCARHQASLQCGVIQYDLSLTDSADAVMEEMILCAFNAAAELEAAWDTDLTFSTQWHAFFKKIFPDGYDLIETISALRYEPSRDINQQFLEHLNYLSQRMPDDSRALFFLDMESLADKKSSDSWSLILRNVPSNIKFFFALTEASEPFSALTNSQTSKCMQMHLGPWSEGEVRELVEEAVRGLPCKAEEVQRSLLPYREQTYALFAALELLKDGEDAKNLPFRSRPEAIAKAQWRRVCRDYGPETICLLEAYAALEVPAPAEVIDKVCGLIPARRRQILSKPYIRSLVRSREARTRIRDRALQNFILNQATPERMRELHLRASGAYRHCLQSYNPTGQLAACRILRHMREVETPDKIIYTFINVCTPRLIDEERFETAINHSRRLLNMNSCSKVIKAALWGNLGVIYKTKGRLKEAEQMQRKVLELSRQMRRLQGVAHAYINLGEIYHLRGEHNYAKNMYLNGLNISNKIKDLEGVLSACSRLGTIYLKKGDHTNAERAFRQALQINEQLGRTNAVAVHYGNLGSVFLKKGDHQKAKLMYRRALELHQKIRNHKGMAEDFFNLGKMYHSRREHRRAELMHQKALESFRKPRCHTRMAEVHISLARIYISRGNHKQAMESLGRARGLFARLGIRPMVEKVQEWIDSQTTDIPELSSDFSPLGIHPTLPG